MLVDLSRAMLERAAQRIAEAAGTACELPAHVRLLQADIHDLPFGAGKQDTVLGLGLLHLFDDLPGLVEPLQDQLRDGGACYLSGLVGETRRGARYLRLLHRAGESATPRTAADLADLLPAATVHTMGCMAFVRLPGAARGGTRVRDTGLLAVRG